jgi:hypothetical protein
VPVAAVRPPGGTAASSGVRGTASDAPPALEDFREDAPQFFDRKLLRSLETPPPSSGTPPPKDALAGPPAGVAAEAAAPGSSDRRPGRPGWVRWARWGGYALVAIGIATAALFALR